MQDNRAHAQSTLVLGVGELGMSVLRSLAAVAEAGMVVVLMSLADVSITSSTFTTLVLALDSSVPIHGECDILAYATTSAF